MARPENTSGPQVNSHDGGSLARVGIIAAVGFAIGIVWPRLAGVSLVPEAPVDRTEHAVAEAANSAAAIIVEPEIIELTPEDRLAIGPPKITSCVNSKGKKSSKCDAIDVDQLVHSQLIALLGCSGASGVFGNLSLGFRIDFEAKKIESPKSGRSTNLPKDTTRELLACAKTELSTVKWGNVAHEFSQYQVYYSLSFKTPEAAAEEKTSVVPASGMATVQWGTALVRKEGNDDAKIQTRLMSGARVVVTGRLGAWYRVKYDAKGREGWVIGKALGLK